jgi:hypothetical protein
MAYVREDEKLSRYNALQDQLAAVHEAIERRSSAGIAVDAELSALKRSLEQRMAELKENCHLLQR